MHYSNTATTAVAKAVMLLIHLQNKGEPKILLVLGSNHFAAEGKIIELNSSRICVDFMLAVENYQWQKEKQASKMEAEMVPDCYYRKEKQKSVVFAKEKKHRIEKVVVALDF
ncbi:D-aminoacyl-tRNA deacylase DtdA [Forsythia ovata]|uniref:D-aminoacyl-tRNA deacylase DtdA n=1 Tax=Forsythia ovata TaxID=205694 RepID=A0ABD1SJV0_9LAMI